MFYAHRLVALHFLENPDNLPLVNHKDANKLNNCLNNLRLITPSGNALEAYYSQKTNLSCKKV